MILLHCKSFLVLIGTLVLTKIVACDYCTSVVGLEDLLRAENHFIDSLENYLIRAEQENEVLAQFLDEIDEEIHLIQNVTEYFFGNPLYAFGVLRRVTFDWKQLLDSLLKNSAGEVYSKNISILEEGNFQHPEEEDLQGAAKGLARLQTMYALPTVDVANGILSGKKLSQSLSYTDCFHMGRVLSEVNMHSRALEWLVLAKLRLDEYLSITENTYEFPFVLKEQMLENLAQTVFNLGNYKMALSLISQLLALESNNEVGLKYKPIYEEKVQEERRAPNRSENSYIQMKTELETLSEKVCRGELQQSPTQKSKLFCRYEHKHVPFCRIAPFKMEQLNEDPFVALYHEAIYDSEISKIINATADKIERSRVGSLGNSQYSESRTSKNAWLWWSSNSFLGDLSQRLTDITGLSLETGEAMQVANYGIGGHYAAHYDFSEDPKQNYENKGNRILTALFYINKVELGGATAFPFLHLAVPPIRRSLLVWYNMHESLELDYRTRHIGCPVLKGSKWICNEWFHERAQEFLRPCSLDQKGYISLPYKNIQ